MSCSGADEPNVPTRCLELMRDAADAPIVTDEEVPELIETLTACESADAWVDALRAHPAAMGVEDAASVDPELDLQVVCFGREGTPVCADAAADGLI